MASGSSQNNHSNPDRQYTWIASSNGNDRITFTTRLITTPLHPLDMEVQDSDINVRNTNRRNRPSDRRQNQVCRFFKQGICVYGERCRFKHENVVQNSPSDDIGDQTGASTSSTDECAGNIRSPASLTTGGQSTAPTATALGAPVSTDPEGTLRVNNSDVSIYNRWVDAPEFVPAKHKAKSYAQAVKPSAADDIDKSALKLCPYAEVHGVCSYADGECNYVHGDICDLCGNAALHPFNAEKRKTHTQDCIRQHERNMELSFAIARSKEKTCGVCFEVIMEKSAREQRFGILPNCNHCFCLTCIRRWRQAKQFDNKIIRACPECRVTSDFVCPSMYWVDTKEDKDKLIKDYKCALSQKDCKYFKQGRGKCPFGNKCFYLHALPDGTKTDVGPPPRQTRRQTHDGDMEVLQQIILWDFLDDRDHRWLYSIADDLDDLVGFFSDSEDSDWSEYDFVF